MLHHVLLFEAQSQHQPYQICKKVGHIASNYFYRYHNNNYETPNNFKASFVGLSLNSDSSQGVGSSTGKSTHWIANRGAIIHDI